MQIVAFSHPSRYIVITMACAVCGSSKALNDDLCYWGCYWLVEGWVGFNARDRHNSGGKVVFRDHRALGLWAQHRQSYTKMISTARALGWQGVEGYTFTMRPPTLRAVPGRTIPFRKVA